MAGHDLSINVSEEIYTTRALAADFFGCEEAEDVIFTPSCTYAINFALKGILKRGDHVLTSSVEHNAVIRPLEALRKQGVMYDIVEVAGKAPEDIVKGFRSKIRYNTKAIVCMHASNVFGIVLPITEIGQLCKERGLRFIVDSAQTAGKLPIHMKNMNIDFLCIASHKGLYAPMGTGILIARKSLGTIIEGGTGTNSRLFVQPEELPERMESGTVNVPGIFGIKAGVEFVKEISTIFIYDHEIQLVQTLYDGLKQINGVILYTDRPEKECNAAVLSFNINGFSSEDISEMLNENGVATRAGLHCSPLGHKAFGTETTGTVRLSPSVFTTVKDIQRTLEYIDFFVKKH